MPTGTSPLASLNDHARRLGRERGALAIFWLLAVLGCLMGLRHPAPATAHIDALEQASDLLRALTSTVLAVVLVLGPGIALRASRRGPDLQLGYLPLPGLALLAATGGAAWAVGLLGWIHPRIVCTLFILPVLGCLLAVVKVSNREHLLSPEEWRVLALVGGGLAVAVARSLWSLGPAGELYAGTIYRTLEASDRPDSRISFHIVELVTNGNPPFGPIASSYFSPYTFSDRGPLGGLASVPIVLISGGRPPRDIGSAAWTPFDAQGFMAYRLAMMTFAATAFLSLWSLAVHVFGRRAARLAVLLAVTTPFLVHEIWFTWPKLLAASFVLLAALSLLDRRRLTAGLLVGVGYLCHPLALLSLPALGLLALWPAWKPRLRRSRIDSVILLLVGVALCVVAWRLVNGSHYTQSGFLDYLKQAGSSNTVAGRPVTLTSWLNDRLVSVGNSLVPMRLFLLSAQDQEVNAVQACFPFCHGGSPPIVHFFFQFWDTVPFGLGILFFPLLVQSLWRALRRWTWPVTATVIVPFVTFAVYWGGASTGLLREGMHPWVLTLILVVCAEQCSHGFGWLRSRTLLGILALRALEVLLVAMLPTVVAEHRLIDGRFWVSDTAAVLAMAGLSAALAAMVWRERAPAETVAPPPVAHS